MKKTYIKPTTGTVHVETRQIIAASPLIKGDTNTSLWQNLNEAPELEETITSGNLSRGFGNSVWDEWDF